MEWLEALRGSTVGLDIAPLIYYIEEHPVYLPKVQPFFEAAERGELRIVTSFVTLVEVLVQPLRRNRPEVAQEYRDILLRSAALTTIPLDEGIAEAAAILRAERQLRTADAIQVATAIGSGASWFLTNDEGLADVPGVSSLILDRLA
ncbi:MAG: type II toxin-antitoxin system VapC family toxin [Bryobacterales bacterium]|nr:type II toxin-antitoxin system VapC family toxin [Bryobacterales bacterium]